MPGDRIFSDEELRVAGLRSVDAFLEALERGDREAATRFARRLRREALSMRLNYDAWEASLLGWIRRLDAGDALELEAREGLDLAGGELPDTGGETAELDFGERWRDLERRIAEALAEGRDAEARQVAQRLHEEALAYHDRGMARVCALLSWLGRRLGTEALEEAYVEAMSVDLLGNAGFRERAEALMHFTRVHLQPFALEEDDEKLTFLCPVCPSGGRLLREGHYEPPREGHHVQGPRWLTWGRESLPVYCAHEPVMERATILASGVPLFLVEPSDELGRIPCRTYLYKDPADIPERFYTRLGLEKPKP